MRTHSILLVGENTWLIRALRLLIESDSVLSVSGACAINDVIAVSKQTAPDIVLFLPEISLIETQTVFVGLHELLPKTSLILITPVDTGIYEAISNHTPVDGFVSQGSLIADLLPKIRTFMNQTESRIRKYEQR